MITLKLYFIFLECYKARVVTLKAVYFGVQNFPVFLPVPGIKRMIVTLSMYDYRPVSNYLCKISMFGVRLLSDAMFGRPPHIIKK